LGFDVTDGDSWSDEKDQEAELRTEIYVRIFKAPTM